MTAAYALVIVAIIIVLLVILILGCAAVSVGMEVYDNWQTMRVRREVRAKLKEAQAKVTR